MVPFAAVVVAFAVVNRQAVELDLWPAPFAATLPVWAVALGGGLIGFLAGSLAAWSAGSKARAAGRAARRRADGLDRDLTLEREKTTRLEKAAKDAAAGATGSAARLAAPAASS